MADKEKLSQMLDALVNNNPEEAQVAFHGYAQEKMKEEIHGVEDEDSGNTEPKED